MILHCFVTFITVDDAVVILEDTIQVTENEANFTWRIDGNPYNIKYFEIFLTDLSDAEGNLSCMTREDSSTTSLDQTDCGKNLKSNTNYTVTVMPFYFDGEKAIGAQVEITTNPGDYSF